MRFGVAFANVGPMAYPEGAVALAQAAEAGGLRVAVDRRAHRRARGLRVDLPLQPHGPDARTGGLRHPRPAHLADLRRRRHLDDPSRHGHPDPAAAQPGGAGQGGGHPRPALRRAGGAGHRRGVARGGVRGHRHPVRGPRRSHRRPHRRAARAVDPGPGHPPRAPSRRSPTPSPVPDRRRRSVPIVVGGHSKAAARRAGRLGDGFFPGPRQPRRAGRPDPAHAGGRRRGRPRSRCHRDHRRRQRRPRQQGPRRGEGPGRHGRLAASSCRPWPTTPKASAPPSPSTARTSSPAPDGH